MVGDGTSLFAENPSESTGATMLGSAGAEALFLVPIPNSIFYQFGFFIALYSRIELRSLVGDGTSLFTENPSESAGATMLGSAGAEALFLVPIPNASFYQFGFFF